MGIPPSRNKSGRKRAEVLTDKQKSKVIDIQFGFNNHQIINQLTKRGAAIVGLHFDKIKEIDHKIAELIEQPDLFDAFTIPVCAFITFASDDALVEAVAYAKDKMFRS